MQRPYNVNQQLSTRFIALTSSSLSRNSFVMVKSFCSGSPNLVYHVLSMPKQASLTSVTLVSIRFFSFSFFSSSYSDYWLTAVGSVLSPSSSSSFSSMLVFNRLFSYLARSRVYRSRVSYSCLLFSSYNSISLSSITASNYFFLFNPSTNFKYFGSLR